MAEQRILVVLEFEASEELDGSETQNLEDWVNGTFDNAMYDEDVGFPASKIECPPMVVEVAAGTIREEE